jgi:hypothetical protein
MVIPILLLLAQTPAPAGPATPTPVPSSQPGAAALAVLGNLFPQEAAPADGALGVPIYPNAVFLTSYDAGRGQRYYLYGTLASHAEIVAYYRTLLKNRGTTVYETPATHIFEVGRYNESTMAFPPSVTVKDYAGSSGGYLNPRSGADPARFPTVIQIVPAPR